MARILFQKRFYVLFFCILEFCTCSDDFTCVQETECLCKFNNDKVIDISHLSDDFQVTEGNSTYFFFGCRNGNVPDSKYINVTNNCKDTSLCLYNATTNQLVNLGNKSQIKFNQSEDDSHLTEIVYTTQEGISTVSLICNSELSKSMFLISPKSGHNLLIISPSVCKFTRPHGLSTGSTLLILFLVGCTIYFVGGAVVLHFLRGARGTEMIPNIDFWRDLPNLVKDGLIFLLNGCRPTAVATAESYDRI